MSIYNGVESVILRYHEIIFVFADGVGFEPTVLFTERRFSKPLP